MTEADSQLAGGIELVQVALDMLDQPRRPTVRSPTAGPKQLNQAFHQRMYVDDLGIVNKPS